MAAALPLLPIKSQKMPEGVVEPKAVLKSVSREAPMVRVNGEEALRRLTGEPNRYDLVILDVMLPGMDGFEVATGLRAARRFVPVLFGFPRTKSLVSTAKWPAQSGRHSCWEAN